MMFKIGDVCKTKDPRAFYGDWRLPGRTCVVVQVDYPGHVTVVFDDMDGWADGSGRWGMPVSGLILIESTGHYNDVFDQYDVDE